MTSEIDFGAVAEDYERYRFGFPYKLLIFLKDKGVFGIGKLILDLGTGTGKLARDIAALRCEVVGIDKSPEMIKKARCLNRISERFVLYAMCYAEMLPFKSSIFDTIVAGQSWHWFHRSHVASEAFRTLKSRGKIVITHFDWIPLPNNVVEVTEKLIKSFNPYWKMGGGTGIYPAWLTDLAIAKFVDIKSYSFDLPVYFSHENWCGRIRASAGIGASLSQDIVNEFDKALRLLLIKQYPTEPLEVPHRIFVVIARKKK